MGRFSHDALRALQGPSAHCWTQQLSTLLYAGIAMGYPQETVAEIARAGFECLLLPAATHRPTEGQLKYARAFFDASMAKKLGNLLVRVDEGEMVPGLMRAPEVQAAISKLLGREVAPPPHAGAGLSSTRRAACQVIDIRTRQQLPA